MPVFLLACVVSFVPSVSLFLLLRNRLKEEDAYKKLCSQTLWQGAKCTLPVILLSGCSYIILRLTGLHNTNPLLYQALYKFIVLALMEEAAKYWGFKRILKKTDYAYSWLDTAVLMTIIGLGFGMLESVIYAIGASVPVVLVRGICVPHAGYGFLTGYFYGKGSKTGKPVAKWAGFLLSSSVLGLHERQKSNCSIQNRCRKRSMVAMETVTNDGVWDNIISNTDKGSNKSPQLEWTAVDGAGLYVIIMDDPTAMDWMH